MKSLLNLFRRSEVKAKPAAKRSSPTLALERLEVRQLMTSGISASLLGGVLTVRDASANDAVHIRQLNGQISVDGTAIQVGGVSQTSVSASVIRQIDLHTPAGNDQVWLGDVGHALTVPVSLLDGAAGDTLFTPANPGGLKVASGVAQVLTSGGAVFTLNNSGQLFGNAPSGWRYLDGGVQAIAGTGGASVFDLHTDGRLFRQDTTGSWAYLDGGVKDIAGTGGASVFDLHADGRLFRQDIGGAWAYLDGGVQAIAGTGGASVFDLHADGRLFRQDTTGSWAYLDGGVKTIAGTGGVSVFDLHGDGRLFRQDTTGSWAYLDGGVQSIVGAGGASVFDLHGDGRLFRQDMGGTWAYLDGGVQTIAGTGGASVFDLHTNGYLYRQDMGGTWAYLDGGVKTIVGAGDGSVLDLHTDGQLYRQTIGGSWSRVSTSTTAADGSVWFLSAAPSDAAGNQAIYRLSSGQLNVVCVTSTAIGSKWFSLGGPSSPLGLPVSDVISQNGQLVQIFQKGALCQNPDGRVWLVVPPPANIATSGAVAVDLSGNTSYLVVANADAVVPPMDDPILPARVGVIAVAQAGGVTGNYGGTIITSGESSSPTTATAGGAVAAVAGVVGNTYHSDQSGFWGTLAGMIKGAFGE